MTISITNQRKRLVTLLVQESIAVRAVRIPHGHTERDLPEAVLDLPLVKEGQARGDLVVRRDRAPRAGGRT
jgi:hypothetical protein